MPSFCNHTQKNSALLLGICPSTHRTSSGISVDIHRIHTNWTREASKNIVDTEIIQCQSFCDHTQKNTSTPLGICASTYMNSSGLSADIRRIHTIWTSEAKKNIEDMQSIQSRSFCDYAQKKSAPLLGICASAHMIGSGISADIRRIHTNWTRKASKNTVDTQIIQCQSFCDHTQKKSASLLGICASTHMIGSGISAAIRKIHTDIRKIHTYWTREGSKNIVDSQIIQCRSFCDHTQKKIRTLLGICASTHMISSGVYADIRRSSVGVSATVRRHSNYG